MNFFSITKHEIETITNETLPYWQEISKSYNVGDKAKSGLLTLVEKESELDILYSQHLKAYLNENKNVKENDFIEDEIKTVLKLITKAESNKDYKKEWYGLMKRYLELLSDRAKIESFPNAFLPHIFKKEYFKLCLYLLQHFDIIDDKNKVIMKATGTTGLQGVILAVEGFADVLLNKRLSRNKLKKEFEKYLNIKIPDIKPSYPGTDANKNICIEIILGWQGFKSDLDENKKNKKNKIQSIQ